MPVDYKLISLCKRDDNRGDAGLRCSRDGTWKGCGGDPSVRKVVQPNENIDQMLMERHLNRNRHAAPLTSINQGYRKSGQRKMMRGSVILWKGWFRQGFGRYT